MTDRREIEEAAFVFEKTDGNMYECTKARHEDATIGNYYPEAIVKDIAERFKTLIIDEPRKLAEVIAFPSAANEMASELLALAAEAARGNITGYVIAMVGPDRLNGMINTGWNNVGLAERTVLAQHLQFDVIDAYIDEKLSE